MKILISIGLLVALTGCRTHYIGEPYFTVNYQKEFSDLRLIDHQDVDRVAQHCCQVVEEIFDIDPITIEVKKSPMESKYQIEFKDGVVKANIFSMGTQVFGAHLNRFTAVTAHEITEWLIGCKKFQGCDLYGSDLCNRWIGEGVSELVSTIVFKSGIEKGLPLISNTEESLEDIQIVEKDGVKTVNLEGWGLRVKDKPWTPSYLNIVRYSCSEYLLSKWYEAAKIREITNPLRTLYHWVLKHPGPTYEELTDWMSELSGLQIREMAKSVNLEDVKKYFHECYLTNL